MYDRNEIKTRQAKRMSVKGMKQRSFAILADKNCNAGGVAPRFAGVAQLEERTGAPLF